MPENSLQKSVDTAREQIANLPQDRRLMIAIAGAPASGKSTLTEHLVDALNADSAGTAAILPMDGYHYDDEVLVPRGWRPRKGAPHTFDVGGLAAMVDRLKRNEEADIAVPRFDRDIEIARAGASLIPQSTRIVVVEGLYMLLNQEPWNQLKAKFDLTIMVRVTREELERRLRDRWVGYGLTEPEIQHKLYENDLPNGEFVYANSATADLTIDNL